MHALEETKKRRFQFLNKLHEVTGGSSYSFVQMREIGAELGFDVKETANIVEYLVGEQLVAWAALGGMIKITHYGRKEIESALSSPERPTTYFPPVVNILHVQNMVGSQIQQGTHGGIQKMSLTRNQLDDIREFIGLLKSRLADIPLDGDANVEVGAEIATVEAQLQSSRPKRGIVHESLQSIRKILEGAAGSLVASGLLPRLTAIITALSQ